MFNVCVVICVIFGIAVAIPANYVKPLILPELNVYLDSESKIQISEPDPLENNKPDDARAPAVYHDVVNLPTSISGDVLIPQSPYNQDGIEGILSIDYAMLDHGKIHFSSDQYLQSAPESSQAAYDDQEPTKVLMGIEMDNYDEDDDSLPNPVVPLDSLPHIYSTYVHESVPSLESRKSYDIDVLNPENIELLVPNMRPTRSKTEDLITELQHEAMIKNIIPTMGYIRDAEKSYPALTAVYPRVASGCRLPILFDCNPNLNRGELTNTYPYLPPASAVPYEG